MRQSPSPDVADRGASALVVLVVVGAIGGAALAGLVGVGGLVVDANRARSAADAVALAGVEHGRERAEVVAAANGATVVSWSQTGPPDARTLTVVVEIGRSTATARATTSP